MGKEGTGGTGQMGHPGGHRGAQGAQGTWGDTEGHKGLPRGGCSGAFQAPASKAQFQVMQRHLQRAEQVSQRTSQVFP